MRTDAHVNGGRRGWRRAAWWALCAVIVLSACGVSRAQEINTDAVDESSQFPRSAPLAADRLSAPVQTSTTSSGSGGASGFPVRIPDLSSRENVSAALQIVVLLTVLSLAPAILIMMTSFTRIIIVLSLLRQALGTQQLPPNQVLVGLSLFMTFVIMGPTWQRVNDGALQPYMDGKIEQKEALSRAQDPVREFMIRQIVNAGNEEDVYLFAKAAGKGEPAQWKD